MQQFKYSYRDTYVSNNRDVIINLRDVETKIDKHIIHRSVNLDVYKGELLCLIGASGVGKSFLLRNILQLHKPSKGNITYVTNGHAWDEKFYGVLFQDGALFSSLNVYENICVPLRRIPHLTDNIVKKMAKVRMLQLGLDVEDMHKYPAELSGGMRKRVALARALSAEPQILFLDEPTAGLDPISIVKFNSLIKYLQKALNLTIFMVTHDLDTLRGVADRVAVLFDGEIIVADTVDAVERNDHEWIKTYFVNKLGVQQ